MSVEHTVAAWKEYVDTIGDWQALTTGVDPKPSGCGHIYELTNPIDRPSEDFAIADMRELKFAEPHYHPDGVYEFYFVLQGSGKVVVGDAEQEVGPGSVVVMPPYTAHFTIPGNDLVVAVVSSPPFRPEHYIVVDKTDPSVHFDKAHFDQLVGV